MSDLGKRATDLTSEQAKSIDKLYDRLIREVGEPAPLDFDRLIAEHGKAVNEIQGKGG